MPILETVAGDAKISESVSNIKHVPLGKFILYPVGKVNK